MKIEKIDFSRLRNDAHFQFFTEVIKLVERYGAAQLKIEPQFDALLALYADEDTALKKILKSSLTADIQEADRYRDEIWRGMTDANRSAMRHFDDAVRQAAERLKIVFDTYGNIAAKPLDEETSAIYNILQDFDGKYSSDAVAVRLTGWMDELRATNDRFQTLMTERYDEAAARTALRLKEVRLQVDAAYRTITERINAAIIMEGAAPYAEFVTTLNTVVKRFADILAQQKGRRKKSSEQLTTNNEQ
jgi:transcription elongation GreA/GreB family factor